MGFNQNLTQAAPAATGWVRDPNWMDMPTIGTKEFAGLYLVFENEYNELGIRMTSGKAEIDWGDGSPTELSTGADQYHVYDYSTVTGDINVFKDGRNYKQVMVSIVAAGDGASTLFYIDRFNYGLGQSHFVDIILNWDTVTAELLARDKKMTIIERIRIVDWGPTAIDGTFDDMPSLQVLEIPFNGYTANMASMLAYSMEKCESINGEDKNIVAVNCDMATAFLAFPGKELGNLTISGVSSIASQIFQNAKLRKIGDITISDVGSFINMFFDCWYLEEIGLITTDSNTTNISGAFNDCYALREVIWADAQYITTISTGSSGTFSDCYSLHRLVLPGVTVGFSAITGQMTKTAIDETFTNLGTASGAQTITMTNHPGSATCDTSIATAKGFTVVV